MQRISSYFFEGGDVQAGYPLACTLTFYRAREQLADDEVDRHTARALDEVQGDDRLRLHVSRVRQKLGHEGLQGELIDGPLNTASQGTI